MKNKLIVGLLALGFVLLAGVGCKKSVKGEESRWTSANQEVDKLTVLYPGFKSALDARRTAAKTIYDKAQTHSEEKDRISQLSNANSLLSGGFVGELAKLDEQLKGFRQQLVDATGAKVEGADMRRNQAAIDEAKRTLASVEALIRNGAADPQTADIVMNQVAKELAAIKNHIAQSMPAAPGATAGSATAAAGSATAAPAAPAANVPQPWTCEYCSHVNEPGAATCTQCGAAHAKH